MAGEPGQGGAGADGPVVDLGIPGFADAVELARGGFGVVYRARQPAFGRTVALKVLSGASLDERTRERFERECQAMGSLSGHPGIVTVYESGWTADGRPYLAMELMGRGSLADQLARRGTLPWDEAAQVGVRLAGALEAAHRAGVLHRDIKPENVLVSSYGEPKLADFGIARIQGGVETRTGVVTASVVHAPPEVLQGARPSVASDVYSLASTLWSLLAGSPAFRRETDESLVPMYARIALEPPPDLRVRGVPDPLCRVLEHGMAKDPAHRPASAADLGRALQQAQRAVGLAPTELVLSGDDAPEGHVGLVAVPPTGPLGPRPGTVPPPLGLPPPPPPPPPTQPHPVAAPPPTVAQPVVAAHGAPPPAWPPSAPGQWAPAPPPRRRTGLWLGLGAAVVVAAGIVGGIALLGGGDEEGGGPSPGTDPVRTTELAPTTTTAGPTTTTVVAPDQPTVSFSIAHEPAGEIQVVVGVADGVGTSLCEETVRFVDDGDTGTELVDDVELADCADLYPPSRDTRWFLEVGNFGDATNGTIDRFQVTGTDGVVTAFAGLPLDVPGPDDLTALLLDGTVSRRGTLTHPPRAPRFDFAIDHAHAGDLFVAVGVRDATGSLLCDEVVQQPDPTDADDGIAFYWTLGRCEAQYPPTPDRLWYLEVADRTAGDVGQVTRLVLEGTDGGRFEFPTLPVDVPDGVEDGVALVLDGTTGVLWPDAVPPTTAAPTTTTTPLVVGDRLLVVDITHPFVIDLELELVVTRGGITICSEEVETPLTEEDGVYEIDHEIGGCAAFFPPTAETGWALQVVDRFGLDVGTVDLAALGSSDGGVGWRATVPFPVAIPDDDETGVLIPFAAEPTPVG